jgi:glycosyltransferase involved in cell wall biosynthesis
MRILIIGDYPGFSGGVTNYTRPLALEFAKSNEVYYLYNNSRRGKYTIGGSKIIKSESEHNYHLYELVNGSGLEKNYDHLLVDVNEWFDQEFEKLIREINPDVIHINEIFGFSSSIIHLAKRSRIKVAVTVHEYWWLCPHRVMVDFNRQICEGPSDLQKCSFCVSGRLKHYSGRRIKISYILKNQFSFFYKSLAVLRNSLSAKKSTSKLENLAFLDLQYKDYCNSRLETKLKIRLQKNIDALNNCDVIICVSKDVKDTLTRYGVNPERLVIQHIGSTIADQHILHTKQIEKDNLVFGFIGGIRYYKGVHQLVEAYMSMAESYRGKSLLKLYGNYDQDYLYTIKETILKGKKYSENVIFYGRYSQSDMDQITNLVDIIVLPSLCADTASQTIFESFSCQVPIIAPAVGGFPDFIKDDINGLLYDSASVESLRKKLELIIENPDRLELFRTRIPKLKTMSENCRELYDLFCSL